MAQIKIRRGTEAELTGVVLALGELGYTTDTKILYIGNGVSNTQIGSLNAEENRILDAIPTDGNTDNSVSSDGVFDALTGKSDTGHGHTSSEVLISTLGSPTYTTQAQSNSLYASTGCTGDFYISDAGSENITVAAGSGFIKATDSDETDLLSFDWAADTIAIPTDTVRYIGVKYTAPTAPAVVSKVTDDWDHDTEFPLGTVTNIGGTLHISNNPWQVTDAFSHIIERFQADRGHVSRDVDYGGLIISESADGNRYVLLSQGRLWSRFNKVVVSAINTSGTDRFTTFHGSNASGWVTTENVQLWSNTNYNDGSTTLATTTNNQYVNLWWYVTFDGDLYMLYGTEEHPNSSIAETEAPPQDLPPYLHESGLLIGRFIIQQGDNIAIEVQTTFDTQFTATQTAVHSNLGNLDYASSGHTGFAEAIHAHTDKLNNTTDTFVGDLTLEGTPPSIIFNDTANSSYGRALFSGPSLFLEAGALYSGDVASSGNIYFSGYKVADINLFKVRVNGAWEDVYHSAYAGTMLAPGGLTVGTGLTVTAGGANVTGGVTIDGNSALTTLHTTNHPAPTDRDTRNQIVMGTDDNYVTDIEKSNLHAPGSDDQDLSGKADLVGGNTFTGVQVISLNYVRFDDAILCYFGSDHDSAIWNNGSDLTIRGMTAGHSVQVQGKRTSDDANVNMFMGDPDGGFYAYYAGAYKFGTTELGIDIVGRVQADDLLIDTAGGGEFIGMNSDFSGITNYIYAQNGSGKLYLGVPEAIATFRSDVDVNENALENVDHIVWNNRVYEHTKKWGFGAYFIAGEWVEIIKISPSANSENYAVVGEVVVTSGSALDVIKFEFSVRANALPSNVSKLLSYSRNRSDWAGVILTVWFDDTTGVTRLMLKNDSAGNVMNASSQFTIHTRGDYRAFIDVSDIAEYTAIDAGFTEYTYTEQELIRADIINQTNVNFGDNRYIYFGDDSDWRLFFNGADYYNQGIFPGGRFVFQGYNSEATPVNKNIIIADPDGGIDLYYAGNIKFSTVSDGVSITGGLVVTGATTAPNFWTTATPNTNMYSVWGTSGNYAIGMSGGATAGDYTYGELNGYAMTFTMDGTDTNWGWLWRGHTHSLSEGAMSLTTLGELTVDKSIATPVTIASGGTLALANDTKNNVAIAMENGTAIYGYSTTGYQRNLLEWTTGNAINIGQTGTSLISGINLSPGVNGIVDSDGDIAAPKFVGKDTADAQKFEMVWNDTESSIDFNFL